MGFFLVLNILSSHVVGLDGEELLGEVEDLVVLIVLVHEQVNLLYFGVGVDAFTHNFGEIAACG